MPVRVKLGEPLRLSPAYLIRATFSQKRLDYSPEQATVVYRSKDGKEKKTCDALEWLAAMACHVPERGKQTIF